MKYEDLKDWKTKYGFSSPEKRMKIYYSPLAFAKTVQLVKAYQVEIGWNMVVTPYQDGYKVWDILVYPQKISAARIYVDTGRWGLWKAMLDDETEASLFGHGHSHVFMSTFVSDVDENQQCEEILTKGKGFYFFQIWNKRNEINSLFYDIDNKVFYQNKDIEIIVEDVDNFVSKSFYMVTPKRTPMEVGEGFESKQVV